MRLIKITAPQGKGTDIAKLALECGISEVSLHPVQAHRRGMPPSARDVIDMRLSTPQAKAFIDALLDAPFFTRKDYAVEVREARAILKSTSTRDITVPVPAPVLDIDEELWQFTHVTCSLIARVLIAALLLAYGMVEDNLLFMVGGLIFLPFMPLVLALAFGMLARQWTLVAQALLAFVLATGLIVVGAALVASLLDPPLLFDKFAPPAAGVAFSLLIGIAGALGTADDTGHRQLVGLAAASQLAILPAWFGISLVFGFSDDVIQKLASFAANAAALTAGSFGTYALLGFRQFSYRIAHRKEYEV